GPGIKIAAGKRAVVSFLECGGEMNGGSNVACAAFRVLAGVNGESLNFHDRLGYRKQSAFSNPGIAEIASDRRDRRDRKGKIHHGFVMTDRRSQASFIVAAPAAPLQPTAVRMWHFAHAYPALIPQRTWCASGTELGYRYAAPVGALNSGRGWCFVAPGCIFERGTENSGFVSNAVMAFLLPKSYEVLAVA